MKNACLGPVVDNSGSLVVCKIEIQTNPRTFRRSPRGSNQKWVNSDCRDRTHRVRRRWQINEKWDWSGRYSTSTMSQAPTRKAHRYGAAVGIAPICRFNAVGRLSLYPERPNLDDADYYQNVVLLETTISSNFAPRLTLVSVSSSQSLRLL
jgi:hypothetical protein